MGLPGFSAEASLYRTSARYQTAARGSDPAAGAASPALSPFDLFIASPYLVNSIRESFADFIQADPIKWFAIPCGGLGESCCRAPAASQNIPVFGPLVGCQKGLGCDITTDTCVANCGGPGQVCCDGPETRAPKWTADGRIYSPNSWNMREMCNQGACDRQSHRCFTCGMQDGSPCCPPDAAQATARCRGENLTCEFDPQGFYTSGTCRACGKQGKPPCDWGCDPGLGIRQGLCALCGGNGQPLCDSGCNPGLGPVKGSCLPCGDVGRIPCDTGCRPGLKLRNGLCSVCGGSGQPPCDAGCNPGTVLKNGTCTACGNDGQVPCANGCFPPMKVAGGVCRYCGANGQVPCDSGCNSGLVASGGKCVPPMQPPDTCAQQGQACIADHVNSMYGKYCCKSGNPLLCVYGQCKACVPHGQPCQLGGSQICCSASEGDTCVLDQFSGQAVCGIPG